MKNLNITILGNTKNYTKTVLLLGAIHGDEKSGTVAINKLIDKCNTGEYNIDNSFRIICIPICNKGAYEKNIRYINYNLNRIFNYSKNSDIGKLGIEGKYMLELKQYIQESDYILDLHSSHADDAPFGFQDSSEDIYNEMYSAISLPYVITGWENLYNKETNAMGTVDYALAIGKVGITIESGNHFEEQTFINAQKYLEEFLVFLGVILLRKVEKKVSINSQKKINMKEFIIKDKPGRFAKRFDTFDRIKEGSTIGKYDDGAMIIAKYDCYIIMPNDTAYIGDEWFYLGVD